VRASVDSLSHASIDQCIALTYVCSSLSFRTILSRFDALRHRLCVSTRPVFYEHAIDEEMHFDLSLDTAAQYDPDALQHRLGNVTHT
jgi:hypothetical protein